jgi:hypothetical protein
MTMSPLVRPTPAGVLSNHCVRTVPHGEQKQHTKFAKRAAPTQTAPLGFHHRGGENRDPKNGAIKATEIKPALRAARLQYQLDRRVK